MKKIFLLLALFSIGAIAFSQGISVRFIGRINDADYCRLDSVAVTNITRNWTETVVSPDTIIVLGGTGNVNLNIAEEQGLGQNIPNPFDCETRVELSVSQRENVRMQLLDVSGKVYAEYNNSLDAGVHTFDISAAAPQTYILNATIGKRSYSIRMVNTGSGCGSSIKYTGIFGSIISKQTLDNEFQIGDIMRYIGYTNIGGNILESEPVQQPLRESQDVELAFRSGNIGVLNGHEWVDLGLPSGTKWATCNVGASSPEEYGDYFAYSDGSGSYNTLTKYCFRSNNGYNGFTDNLTTLVASDDAARANWGASWRMPTQTEMKELLNNCTHIWTSQNGVYGRLFTGPNGNSIFLPAAGYFSYSTLNQARTCGIYWSSSLYTPGSPIYAWKLSFEPDDYGVGEQLRSFGYPVRAVCEGGNFSVPTVTTGTASSITATGATLSGNVTSDGGATVTACGFLYGTNASNLTQTVRSGSGTGSFTTALTGLTPGTTYYYKAYATNSAGTAYGEVMSVALTTAYPPTVATVTANVISAAVCNISGNVTSDGGLTVTSRGFVYDTNANDLTQTVTSGSGTGDFTKTLTDLTASTTYYYKAYATNAVGTSYGEVMSFTTETDSTSYSEPTGYVNGYGYVDLGLPSGTLWATMNVGASTPEGEGDHYAWGETTTKETYDWSTYTYSDNPTTLPSSADAATANWGAGWRMPTQTEMNELLDNCTHVWTTQNGVNGRLFTGPNGNSIFLPVAGNTSKYWSSKLKTEASAYKLQLGPSNYYVGTESRYKGLPVRAVCNQ